MKAKVNALSLDLPFSQINRIPLMTLNLIILIPILISVLTLTHPAHAAGHLKENVNALSVALKKDAASVSNTTKTVDKNLKDIQKQVAYLC